MFERECRSAIAAVRRAVVLCESVSASFHSEDALVKEDRSPVTVADFGAQALILETLVCDFPKDPVVAEEDADVLRSKEAEALRDRVWKEVRTAGSCMSAPELLDILDGGASVGGAKGRLWTLDPIDGTKGFLRGDQYAVALALIEDGLPVLGVLGCPRLRMGGHSQSGFLFYAVRGEGAWCHSLDCQCERIPVKVSSRQNPCDAVFCESVEKLHTSQSRSARVAGVLGVEADPLRIDSQCKYAVVAAGEADVYMRFPVLAGYEEKIWDHAAGALLVEESGGKVTDTEGNALDFSRGRTLSANAGVLASNGVLHEALLRAVRDEKTPSEETG